MINEDEDFIMTNADVERLKYALNTKMYQAPPGLTRKEIIDFILKVANENNKDESST